jgi:hypothetical protein
MTFSAFLHWLLWRDARMSVCGRAWERQDGSEVWRFWVRVWGTDHCLQSWIYHKMRD